MDEVLALRPFVPARDLATSTRFYAALGFKQTVVAANVVVLKSGSFSFILQDFRPGGGDTTAVQMLVRNLDTWWKQAAPERLAAEFSVAPAQPPAMQPWGLRVGFIHDPSGVLWHIAEAPF